MSAELQTLVGDKYEVLERIAEGGMGSIYKVRHRLLDEVRAIKVLRAQFIGDEGLQQRFHREARTAATLRHSGIAQIYDFSVAADGTGYIVMEYVDGATLQQLEGAGLLSIPLAIEISLQSLRAMEYLHRHDVVLRDVAPDNLMITKSSEGGVVCKLIDLGIAKNLAEEDVSITQTGLFIGKARYASPEQFNGEALDSRSDLYSFGVLLYELLTGQAPFAGDSFADLVRGHFFSEPLDFDESDPDGRVPEELRKVVLEALSKEPGKRIQSAKDFGERLKPFLDALAPIEEELASFLSGPVTDPAASAPPAPPTLPPVERTVPAIALTVPPIVPPSPRPRSAETAPPQTIPPQAHPIAPPAMPTSAPKDVVGGTIIMPHAGLGKEDAEALPVQVGRFTLHEFVAEGQTGKLYRAYDPVRKRLVGLKVIHDRSGQAQKRLLRGAGVWLDLRHPNLLEILHVDLGGGDDPALVVTELIEGTDLGRASLQRRFSLEEKLTIVAQLCEALDYMHGKGVIHREVKPGNILISSETGQVTLLDSGIARRTNPMADDVTQVGTAVGDLDYMAPEQMRGRSDERSDIFSVGAVLYELLTGKRPRALDLEQMRASIEEEVHPQRLRSTALRALSLDPDERYSRAAEMADELKVLVPEKPRPTDLSKIVATLHGIRTDARWQRAFSEVASGASLECRLDRWNFGYFSAFRFLLPWARRGRVLWFRETYHQEFGDQVSSPLSEQRPSIVAHSFGTYILGNALVRYPYLRFNKVLLCGSILPTDFPWADIIDRGQVQAVRNEYGTRDLWTSLVRWFVAGTGPSGISGFEDSHGNLHQEEFSFAHSEYFEKGHMVDKWVPFLKSRQSFITLQDRAVEITPTPRPWGLYVLYAAALAIGGMALRQMLG